jgi:gliding motility associated protien GldN
MRRLIISFVAGLICIPMINAQVDEKVEVYEKEHVTDKVPVPYVAVREADVIWAKTIWRIIDLRQKQNMPVYYPTKPIGNRMSLIDLLLYGVKNEGLTVYNADSPEATTEFDVPMTLEEVNIAMDALDDTVNVVDENGMPQQVIVPGEAKTHEVKKLLVKEKWYFDKQHSVMNARIVGLCPIRLYQKEDNPNMLMKKVFWVYYPEARALLTNHEIYNRHNDAQRISYDDFFWQRRFDSYVVAESNVYNNRWVTAYTLGTKAILESNEIENYLFSTEHDMWVY